MVINCDDRFLSLFEAQFTHFPRCCKSHHRYGCPRLQVQYRDVDSLVTQRLSVNYAMGVQISLFAPVCRIAECEMDVNQLLWLDSSGSRAKSELQRWPYEFIVTVIDQCDCKYHAMARSFYLRSREYHKIDPTDLPSRSLQQRKSFFLKDSWSRWLSDSREKNSTSAIKTISNLLYDTVKIIEFI